jgi:hypothetical protein
MIIVLSGFILCPIAENNAHCGVHKEEFALGKTFIKGKHMGAEKKEGKCGPMLWIWL